MVCYSILFGSLIPAVSNRGSTQPSPCHVRRRSRKDPTPSSTQCDFLTFLGASGHKLGGLSVQQEELVQETSRNHIFFPLNHPSGSPLFLKLFLKLCVKHPKLFGFLGFSLSFVSNIQSFCVHQISESFDCCKSVSTRSHWDGKKGLEARWFLALDLPSGSLNSFQSLVQRCSHTF